MAGSSGPAGPSGRRRRFGDAAPDYAAYHDEEWGRPVTDDRGIYERLVLEGFQSGLSWLTILRKRESFRKAFADFEIETVAAFTERRRRPPPERRRDRPPPRQDRGGDRQRQGGGRSEPAAGRARLVPRARTGAPGGAVQPRRPPVGHSGVDRALERAQAPRLPLRRPDNGLRRDAGVWPRQRPPAGLLGPRRGRARAIGGPQVSSAAGWMNALSPSA